MDVTRSPQFLSSTPMLLAVTPFPSPLTTPPVTRMYFMAAAGWPVPCAAVAGGAVLKQFVVCLHSRYDITFKVHKN